jgi:hypothetical protein|tara:strand:+ start:3352 stop:3873 length:522 start_codon:yes stop_codon:yes gene_type:complete
MLYCTGAPKTGTHLLLKALHLFGGAGLAAIHSHKDHNFRWRVEDKRVHIIRNPRNVVISWVRYQKLPRNNQTIIGSMDYIIKRVNGHFGWLKEETVLTVRFEELLTDPSVIKKIGIHIGMAPVDNHFESLWGNTLTFTDDLTNWKDFWNDEVNAAWKAKGGIEIENKLNYVNN